MVGGAPVTQRYADEIGADGYGENAAVAVALARKAGDGVNLQTVDRSRPRADRRRMGHRIAEGRGLRPGECPDYWNLLHPERVREVARAYVEAGSRVILTYTFRANPIALAEFGLAGAYRRNERGWSPPLAKRPPASAPWYSLR